MIVRREGTGWTLIRQMDHAAHCGEISRAWRSGPFGRDAVSPSLEHAAANHDLGWSTVDEAPEIDEQGGPRNFTSFDEARHADFYSAAVRAIATSDPHSAYLVSLHATGLYSARFGWGGFRPFNWSGVGTHGRDLLHREREFRAGMVASLEAAAVEFEGVWREYMLLQTFDVLSLLTCFGLESPGLGPVPTVSGQFGHIALTREGPWEVALDPFPFAGDRLDLEARCIHLDAERFDSDEALRRAFSAALSDTRMTTYLRAS